MMADQITLTVNGKKRTFIPDSPDMTLREVLREPLGLTGTKVGCDNSTCGACTVVMNGKAVKSCKVPLDKIEGSEVLTIEGLANGKELHPIQRAMVEAGAVQCGYCTPGIIMELYALFNEKPDADQDEIIRMLNRHLCRCTGYEAIRDAAFLAQKLVAQRA
jgi:aerobic-type carbon monoxide dehydrogenase small subunit (CoxS/CutS family)